MSCESLISVATQLCDAHPSGNFTLL